MTTAASHTLAVFAAVILAVTSIGTIVTVPPASAQTSHSAMMLSELA